MQTILVVDDEFHIRSVVGTKLRGAGFAVVEAADAVEAFEVLAERAVDLVVTDYEMPGMNGLQMAIELARRPATARLPVVMLTARGNGIRDEDLAMTNVRVVESKPFSLRGLLAQLTKVLAESGAAAGR